MKGEEGGTVTGLSSEIWRKMGLKGLIYFNLELGFYINGKEQESRRENTAKRITDGNLLREKEAKMGQLLSKGLKIGLSGGHVPLNRG